MSTPQATEAIEGLIQAVAEFADVYTNKSTLPLRIPEEHKIIHDALWGTIRLHPWEVAIIDSPLFQRLRQIRQTSLVHYVFPGCSHSRFEHTLGVIHQTQRLVEAINGQHKDDIPFDNDVIQNLRLAALFHDCGHACFSHISENLYQYCPDMQAATDDSGPYPSGHAHEVLGALILKSEPVNKYLQQIKERYEIDFRIDAAAGWIVGNSEGDDENRRYLAQVINGPFDADKLDYIFRDARYSGLPLALDLDRLWASCSVSTLPEGKRQRILSLHRGSATPLEQILFNKINLFSVVYQHPKVRAAEAMFQGAIEYAREAGILIAGHKLENATDFLWITDDLFFASALQSDCDPTLHQMIHDILYRRHYVRALTISNDTIDIDKNDISFQELRKLNHKNLRCHEMRRELAKEIWEKAGRPHTPHDIWLDLPPDPPVGEADRTYVRMPAGTLRKLSDLFPLQYWADLYIKYKWRGHVFCPPECQREVSDAAIQVFHDRFGLEFLDMAKELSHVP